MGCPSCSRRSNPSRQGMAPSPRVLLLPRLACWCVVFLLPSAETLGLDASSELKSLRDLETWGSCVWVEPCLKSTVIAFGKWCSVHVLQTTGSRAALRCLSLQAPRALHKQVPEFYNSFILQLFWMVGSWHRSDFPIAAQQKCTNLGTGHRGSEFQLYFQKQNLVFLHFFLAISPRFPSHLARDMNDHSHNLLFSLKWMHEIPKLERSEEMLCGGNKESSLRSDRFKHTPKSADAGATPVVSRRSTDAAPGLVYPSANISEASLRHSCPGTGGCCCGAERGERWQDAIQGERSRAQPIHSKSVAAARVVLWISALPWWNEVLG